MAEPQTHGLHCPACKVDLVMSERQGIEIDYCPKCRGVWLDRGELDKIIEKSAAAEAPRQEQRQPPQYQQPQYERRYDDDDDDDYRRGGRRRGGFLAELFD